MHKIVKQQQNLFIASESTRIRKNRIIFLIPGLFGIL